MARPLNMDALQQNFWKEEYSKELMLRFGWHQRYGALVKAKQERQRERRKKAVETTLKLPSMKPPSFQTPKSPPPSPLPPPPKPPKEVDLLGIDVRVLETEMKPPFREVRALLYQGTSHEDEGRYRYLRTRALLRPEDKYTFPITTNFNYGWQMGNMAHTYLAPTPKCRIDSFFRKNGAFSLLHPRDVAL